MLDNSGYVVVVVIPETPAAVAMEAMVLTDEEVLKGGNAPADVRLVSLLLLDDENHPLLLPPPLPPLPDPIVAPQIPLPLEEPSFERNPRPLRVPLPLLLLGLVVSDLDGTVVAVALRGAKEKVRGACPTGLAETGEELPPPSTLAAVEDKTAPADSDFVCRRVAVAAVVVTPAAAAVAAAAAPASVVANNPAAAAVRRGVRGLGDVTGRGPNNNLTRSISVFQCGIQSVYSSGIKTSFLSIILPRLTDDSKYGPSQKLHLCEVRR